MTRFFFPVLLLVFTGCTGTDKRPNPSPVENKLKKYGLVDVQSIDPTIRVDLAYSDKNKNYFGEDYYGGLKQAYLRRPVALKLKKAQALLKLKYPAYSLQIVDAARPNSVSHKMYNKMKGTKFEKYVANPWRGSMHNYGVAVDITIVDGRGKMLDMGFAPFYKGRAAVVLAWIFKGKLKKEEKANRALLKSVMTQAGFKPLSYEWWHFDGMDKKYVRANLEMIK